MQALDAKYRTLYEPLYAQRKAVVLGADGGIPGFWGTVIEHHHLMQEEITEKDQGVLRHLQEVAWEPLVEEGITRTEIAVREEIRKIPEGTYTHEIAMDGYGEPVIVKAMVRVKDGGILVDYSGTAPQVSLAMNSPYTYTYAYTCHPLKCVINPMVPNNEGTFRAIEVRAPEGSIVNPRYPAAVAARNLTGHCLYTVLYGALAPAIPDRVIAEGSTPRPIIIVGQTIWVMFLSLHLETWGIVR